MIYGFCTVHTPLSFGTRCTYWSTYEIIYICDCLHMWSSTDEIIYIRDHLHMWSSAYVIIYIWDHLRLRSSTYVIIYMLDHVHIIFIRGHLRMWSYTYVIIHCNLPVSFLCTISSLLNYSRLLHNIPSVQNIINHLFICVTIFRLILKFMLFQEWDSIEISVFAKIVLRNMPSRKPAQLDEQDMQDTA